MVAKKLLGTRQYLRSGDNFFLDVQYSGSTTNFKDKVLRAAHLSYIKVPADTI